MRRPGSVWPLRLTLVSLVAAAMALVGLGLLPDVPPRPGLYTWAAIVSAVLWLCLSPLVYRQGLGMAVSVGLLSPLIAVAPASPLVILTLFFDIRTWVVFPTGAVTGVLVWACLSIGREGGRDKSEH